ncbi:hypothetical protein E2C01_029874 [Portunus trituberculatus]|uniref:Uncharacterized protein n=1 Tax=Portunus trituberculatus TaxID=210409 RepID=A0A5B7ET67_PORTR|nr:hypothetical protein [Portunus trituberculatus]
MLPRDDTERDVRVVRIMTLPENGSLPCHPRHGPSRHVGEGWVGGLACHDGRRTTRVTLAKHLPDGHSTV